MNSFTHHSSSAWLAPLRSGQTAYDPSRLQQGVQHIAQAVVNWLTVENAPRIRRSIQADGQVWQVYDPVDNSVHIFPSEDEVRTWLEQRYYG